MAVPTHFKIVFRGVFTGTPEEWSFGTKFSREAGADPDADLGDINQGQVDTAVETLLNTAGGMFSDKVQAVEWRAYQIGTDGRMEGNPLIRILPTSGFTGTAANKYPPQICCVVTTVAADRGPGRFGRFFLPGVNLPMDTDMRLSANNAGLIAEAATDFLKDVSNAVDMPITAECTAVNVSPSGGPNGTIQEVRHLEVGRVFDTLRSRRRSLLEDRHVHGDIDW